MSFLEKKIKNNISKKIKKILRETYNVNQEYEEINAYVYSFPSDIENIHRDFTKKILFYKDKREFEVRRHEDLVDMIKSNKALILLNRLRKKVDPYAEHSVKLAEEKNFKDWVSSKAKKLVGILEKSIIYVDLNLEEVKNEFNNSDFSTFEEFVDNKIKERKQYIQYEFIKKFIFKGNNKVLDKEGREISNLQKEKGKNNHEENELQKDFGKIINIPDGEIAGREISDEKNRIETSDEEKLDLYSKLKFLKNLMIQLERGDISKDSFEKQKKETIEKIKKEHDINITIDNINKIKNTIKEVPDIWPNHEEAILAKYRKINIEEKTASKEERYKESYNTKIKNLIAYAYENGKKLLGDKILILCLIERAKRKRLETGNYEGTDMSHIKKYAEENNLLNFYQKHALGESKKKSKKIMTEKQLRQFIRKSLI
jgi:hypothetical protein